VNWTVNQKLVERLVYYAETGPSKKILDLYAGAGNFSLPLASAGANVTAVECDEKLIRAGRQSAANLSVGSLEFIQASVEQYFKADGKSSWDVVIADPPRSGLGGLAGSVPKASKLILVYCHLPSFIRDLKVILNSGWKLVSIEPFDMFSKTSYVEVLAIFDRDQSV
jgi:23S rRNA (uracil1939-C5)-methyltransferase